jgi:methyl-accepting chemotaxis protein
MIKNRSFCVNLKFKLCIFDKGKTMVMNLKIKHKILITLFFSITSLLIFSGIGIFENYKSFKNFKNTSILIEIADSAGSLMGLAKKEQRILLHLNNNKKDEIRSELKQNNYNLMKTYYTLKTLTTDLSPSDFSKDLLDKIISIDEFFTKNDISNIIAGNAPINNNEIILNYNSLSHKIIELVVEINETNNNHELNQRLQSYATLLLANDVFDTATSYLFLADPSLYEEGSNFVDEHYAYMKLFDLIALPNNIDDADKIQNLEGYKKISKLYAEKQLDINLDELNKVVNEYENSAIKLQDQMINNAYIIANNLLIESKQKMFIYITIAATFILLQIILSMLSYFSLKPIDKMIKVMNEICNGNLDIEVPVVKQKDEIGHIAKYIAIFYAGLISKKRLEKDQEELKIQTEKEKKEAMANLANDFESQIQSLINNITEYASNLHHNSALVGTAIDASLAQSGKVSVASEQASSNVETVAAAAEEMMASIKDIASQVSNSNAVVMETVNKTESADGVVSSLSTASNEIGAIVQLIKDIAEQINLLALNATIESARAGEAGKGFAVVASEIKHLAMQTTRATEDIAKQIEKMQFVSNDVVKILNEIKNYVNKVHNYSSTVATAIGEQSLVTKEITQNMQFAANSVNEINSGINDINSANSETQKSTSNLLNESKNLANKTEQLQTTVRSFLQRLVA